MNFKGSKVHAITLLGHKRSFTQSDLHSPPSQLQVRRLKPQDVSATLPGEMGYWLCGLDDLSCKGSETEYCTHNKEASRNQLHKYLMSEGWISGHNLTHHARIQRAGVICVVKDPSVSKCPTFYTAFSTTLDRHRPIGLLR